MNNQIKAKIVKNSVSSCEIWGSYSSEYKNRCSLRYDAV